MPPPRDTSNSFTAQQLVALLGPLPPVAQVLARLQHLLADPNSDLEDVAKLIRLDAAMTTRVIKISNSALFGRGSACMTIDEAVNRVGFREILHLVSVAASRAIVAEPLAAYGRTAVALWRESVACAFAAEMLAGQLGEDAAASFLNGLLHAIGRQAINRYAEKAGKKLADEGFPGDFSGAEFALLGFTQADAGACMLTAGNFLPANIEPVRRQYEPLDAPEPFDRLGAVLFAARLLRTAVCDKEPADDLPGEAEILGCLHLSRGDILANLPALRQQLARAEQIADI